jgi:hypothetical protein
MVSRFPFIGLFARDAFPGDVVAQLVVRDCRSAGRLAVRA